MLDCRKEVLPGAHGRLIIGPRKPADLSLDVLVVWGPESESYVFLALKEPVVWPDPRTERDIPARPPAALRPFF